MRTCDILKVKYLIHVFIHENGENHLLTVLDTNCFMYV